MATSRTIQHYDDKKLKLRQPVEKLNQNQAVIKIRKKRRLYQINFYGKKIEY